MKLIGLDYGRRRIGVAATDESGDFIRGLPTIIRTSEKEALAALHHLIVQENPGRIVIGLPLDVNDSETVLSREIRTFVQKLSRDTPIPVEFVDESLTSKRANDIIRMKKKKHRQKKENIDRIAACLILKAYQREKQCNC